VAAPIRTCVGCRATAERASLLRIARGHGGGIVDPGGAAPGRGAYVHRSAGCIEAALARGALVRALRTDLAPGEVGRLRAMAEGDA
jgi:hypothetical protein